MEFKTGETPEKHAVHPIITLKITQARKNLRKKYSKITKLVNVISYCFRFFNNLKAKHKTQGPLSEDERNAALHTVIKLVQIEAFPEEIPALTHNENVSLKSKLLRLNPFLDQDVIKVGGRLNNANMNDSQKHPIILQHVTTLIIRNVHIEHLHAGTQSALYSLREKYWPIDGRNTIRHVI